MLCAVGVSFQHGDDPLSNHKQRRSAISSYDSGSQLASIGLSAAEGMRSSPKNCLLQGERQWACGETGVVKHDGDSRRNEMFRWKACIESAPVQDQLQGVRTYMHTGGGRVDTMQTPPDAVQSGIQAETCSHLISATAAR